MAERVFLHVGTMKSGTSFLQATWWRNRDELAERGLLLPGSRRSDHFTPPSSWVGTTPPWRTSRPSGPRPGSGSWPRSPPGRSRRWSATRSSPRRARRRPRRALGDLGSPHRRSTSSSPSATWPGRSPRTGSRRSRAALPHPHRVLAASAGRRRPPVLDLPRRAGDPRPMGAGDPGRPRPRRRRPAAVVTGLAVARDLPPVRRRSRGSPPGGAGERGPGHRRGRGHAPGTGAHPGRAARSRDVPSHQGTDRARRDRRVGARREVRAACRTARLGHRTQRQGHRRPPGSQVRRRRRPLRPGAGAGTSGRAHS